MQEKTLRIRITSVIITTNLSHQLQVLLLTLELHHCTLWDFFMTAHLELRSFYLPFPGH